MEKPDEKKLGRTAVRTLDSIIRDPRQAVNSSPRQTRVAKNRKKCLPCLLTAGRLPCIKAGRLQKSLEKIFAFINKGISGRADDGGQPAR
jgi:hypothetical protein